MDALRSMVRMPMGSIEAISGLRTKYPRQFNLVMLFGSFYLVAFWARGFEKINCHSDATNYEIKRRARRCFIPYTLLGYKTAFPK